MNAQDPDEILDIINERDEIVGSASRRDIHAGGHFHRAVHIFMFNSSGQIYVQRRSSQKDRYPLKLDSSAAGHVDSGEDYYDAARRESLEELNIRVEIEEQFRYGPVLETDNERVALYICYSDIHPVPNPDEILSGDFLNPEELTSNMERNPDDFVPAFILLWTIFRSRKQ
jgi:isopentenyldiphosphate isomerase